MTVIVLIRGAITLGAHLPDWCMIWYVPLVFFVFRAMYRFFNPPLNVEENVE